VVRKTIISALISAGVLFSPMAASAVGLGKLTVMSGLGQPFRGEIELLAVDRNEGGSLAARLAPPEAFQEANVERSSALISLRFNVLQKKTGQWFVKLTSPQPINEPFLDMLVEINWPSGRLLREYTVLLDPPGLVAEQQPAVPVEVPVGKSLPPPTDSAKAVAPVTSTEMVPSKGRRAKAGADKTGAAKAEAQPEGKVKGETYGPVKSGDTLRKIASSVKPDGVNVEQMLVSLFRVNQQAFSGGNMNRLKTGKILHIPEAGQAAALEKSEAAKEVRAHAADWNAYRQKLAGAVETAKPVHEDQARQAAGGKITTAIEDKAGSKEPAKDVLKLSKSESIGGKGGKSPAAQEDAIARDKAIQDATQRIAELEKSIKDMQRLLEIRSQGMADMQKGKQPAAVPQPPSKPAEEQKTVPQLPEKSAAEEKKTEPASAVTPAAVAEKMPIPASAVAADEQPKPKPKPKVLQPKQPDVPPPSFFSELMGNPLVLGGGALVALLGGLLGARAFASRRKKGGESKKLGEDRNSSIAQYQRARPDEEAAVSGGASDFSSGLTDFTQTGMGSIDTTDVDPIAEAEVYMAYGRDVQAEEILREAMAHDPQRHEIHLKLLEIYSNRKDQGSYEALARQLYAATGGSPNPDWEKAAEMGRGLDAGNPLYGVTVSPEMAEHEPVAADVLGEPGVAVDASPDLDFNLDAVNATADANMDIPLESAPTGEQVEELASDLDFNLGQEEPPATQDAPEPAPETPAAEENMLDFNLEMPAPQPEEQPAEADTAGNLVDFDLETPQPQPEDEPAEVTAEPAAEEQMLNFDLELPETVEQPEAIVPEAEQGAISAESWEQAASDIVLDGELSQSDETVAPEMTETPAEEEALAESVPDFDETMLLDLSEPVPESPVAPVVEKSQVEELETEAGAGAEQPESILITSPAMSDEAMLDFDFSMSDETPTAEAPPQAAPNIDLSNISLDLNAPAGETEAKAQAEDSTRFQETATKLDLAKAYMEMGDKEGAREILHEVLQEGSDEQQEDAKKLLAELA
jgi:pilus assembly protein FimV